ncbi:hypothetical protein [Actinoplanes sp. N902-109]|uniref:hypothetical protein n=1 Tax=Actinoplanes sp. (strain N902-109) TaxID=649831 RepID=UPI0003294F6F|nr:hypothetical protein [Actinoplanes sp. N902-109]AGL19701.1 hypothetical protein L083_6191 [Actinoplanes sp. N902-109]
MRAKGITYDTGFVRAGVQTVEHFDIEQVTRDLHVIKEKLHCAAVRVIGGDPGRITAAAARAAGLGLEVWFSPYPLEEHPDRILELFADCAERAERLRRDGAEVVFVAGAELTLMCHGFVPGATLPERIQHMLRHRGGGAEQLDTFLRRAVPLIRERFHGRVTYAAIPPDQVDWELFDIVSLDLYRSADIADQYATAIARLVAEGKPVAITEVGSATFAGAGDRGAQGLEILEMDDNYQPVRVKGDYERDEAGQAQHLREVLTILGEAGVDAAFVFAFALPGFFHRPGDPLRDLDLASYGIVKVFEDPARAWEPKEAFHALAEVYR